MTELSDRQLDILLSSADGFVGQGGELVEQLAAAVRQLRRSVVTVNVPGKTFRLDKLGECEDALDLMHVYIQTLESERDVLASIVRDLAASDPASNGADDLREYCAVCDQEHPDHTEACAWHRATAYTEAHTSEGE